VFGRSPPPPACLHKVFILFELSPDLGKVSGMNTLDVKYSFGTGCWWCCMFSPFRLKTKTRLLAGSFLLLLLLFYQIE
jgi:hypothetical protein